MHGFGKGLFSECCITFVVLVQGYEQHSLSPSDLRLIDSVCQQSLSFVGLILVYLRKALHESSKISVEHVRHVARI